MNKTLSLGAIVVGILFVLLGIYYWITPAGALPTFLPGYIDGSSVIHIKHGLASVILGLALFAFAWFTGAPKKVSPPVTLIGASGPCPSKRRAIFGTQGKQL